MQERATRSSGVCVGDDLDGSGHALLCAADRCESARWAVRSRHVDAVGSRSTANR